jgi:outer membrane immunogenic protein
VDNQETEMRRFVFAGLGFIALSAAAPAHAADIRMPVKAAPTYVQTFYNWTGFYVGAHVGYAWADFTGVDPVVGVLTDSVSARGFIYGGQLGYNYQMGSWVFGIEGDFSFGDVKHSETFVGLATAEVKLDRIITAAARIGYAFDRTLIYGKFGGAWTQEKYNFTVLGIGVANGTVDRSGWMLGVGLEYAFLGNWSAKIEYNYLDMGRKDVTLTVLGLIPVTVANVDLTVQTVKAGINYRF